MAQFVTHIQPTLVEASHHHPPHYYQHHKDHHGHHKEGHHKDAFHKDCTVKDCHLKECGHKDPHHKDGHHKEHHKDSHKECNVKDCRSKDCHPHKKDKDKDVHHEKQRIKSPPLSEESLKDYHSARKGSYEKHFYKDSHGFKHEYDIHFVDEQGIYREAEVRCHYGENQKEEQRLKEGYGSLHQIQSKSEQEFNKPIPPQFIDIQPVHTENKVVSLINSSS